MASYGHELQKKTVFFLLAKDERVLKLIFNVTIVHDILGHLYHQPATNC